MDASATLARSARAPAAGVVVISGEGMRVAEWAATRADDVLVLDFPPLPDAKELRGPAASRPRGAVAAASSSRSGRQRDLHDRKVERHRRAFVKAAAAEIVEIAERRSWRALVVMGDARLAAEVLETAGTSLPVVDVGHGAQWLSPTELAAAVRPDVERVLAGQQLELVERIRGEALSGGRGAIGLDDCRTTAAEGRIEVLVVDPGLCAADALVEAVAEQGGEVEVALDAAREALGELGGTCALLRW